MGIKRVSTLDVLFQTPPVHGNVVSIDEVDNIKPTINSLLFDNYYDNVLVNLNGKLSVLESIDMEKRTYSRKDIDYHPFMQHVA